MEGAPTMTELMTDQQDNDAEETGGPEAELTPIADEVPAEEAAPESESPQPEEAAEQPVEIQPYRVVEAILFAAESPMPAPKIATVLGVGDARDVRKHIERLNGEYEAQGLSFRIENLAGGFQMLTLPAYNSWLKKLLRTRQETRLSPAALETLSIVAYKQPCTRADIEAVRGVAAGDLLNRLREMNLVKIVGRAEDLGRPMLYGTTKRFLEVFGLPSLDDLPQVEGLGASEEKVEAPAAVQDPVAEPVEEESSTPDAAATPAPAEDEAPAS